MGENLHMPRINAASVADHRDQTMTRLLDAFEAALAEHGYADLTLADVAERAGIARNTVYNYAKDKHALLVATVERAMRSVMAELDAVIGADASAELQLETAIDHLLANFSTGAPRLLALQALQSTVEPGEQASPSLSLSSRIEEIVRRGVAAGEFRPIDDVELTVAMMAGVTGAAVQALGRGDRSPAVIVRETKTILFRALRA
jgi:AcrR family transcriptional regulator